MTQQHDPHAFVRESLDRIHAQRRDQAPDHAKDAAGGLVYDQRCRPCRATTSQPPPDAGPLPAWLEEKLDRVAGRHDAR